MAFLSPSGALLFEDDVHGLLQMMRDSGFDPVASQDRVRTLFAAERPRACESFLAESRHKAEALFDAAEAAGPETMVMMLIAFFVDPRHIMGAALRFSGPAILRGVGGVTLERAEKALEDTGGDIVAAAMKLRLAPRQVMEAWLVGAQARVEEGGLIRFQPCFGNVDLSASVSETGDCVLQVAGTPDAGIMEALRTFSRFDLAVTLEGPLAEMAMATGAPEDPLRLSWHFPHCGESPDDVC